MAGPSSREYHLSSSSSDASPEYESVKQCTPGLVEVLKQCIAGIADKCLSKNLISEDVYGYIRANITESEKASRILECVRAKLKTDSTKFNDFIEVLQSDSFLEGILTQLKDTHERLKVPSQSLSASESLSPASNSPAELTDSVFIPLEPAATAENLRNSHALRSTPEVADSVTRPESAIVKDIGEADMREFVDRVQNIKNARAFGLQLEIEPNKLDRFEEEPANMPARIVVEWFKKTPMMSSEDRRDELHRVLQLPALQERRVAEEIKPFVRQQSSVDSAYSELSSTSGTSSTEALQQYQMSYIESIRCKTEACTVPRALNYVAQYSEWYDIGVNLGLPPAELEKMWQQYQHQDLSSHLVEFWYRWDTDGLSWEKLYQALKKVVEKRERRGSETSQQFRMFHTQPSLPVMPEEPVPTDPMEALETHEEAVKDEIQNLEAKFGDIQLTVLNMLEEKGMSVRIFKRAVKTYPGQVQLSIGNLKTVSGSVEEIEDIFSEWNQTFVWSFLDITLLQCIVKRHGTASLQSAMREYADKLKDFRQRTTVYTLLKVWPCPPPKDAELYEECKRFIQTVNENAKVCTLEKLESLRKNTCEGLVLSKAALVLCRLKPGSITLIWLLPVSLVEHCREALRKRVFSKDHYKQNKITRLELDGDIFPIEEELRHAVRNGKIHMVDDVLKQWIKDEDDINEPDKDGKTALILAAEGDHGSIVVSLLESELGVDLDSRAKHKLWTALFFAYNKQHSRIVKLLLEYGADPTLEDIDGKIPEKVGGVKSGPVQKLVEAGKSLMERVLPSKKNLLALCKDGRVEDVRNLLRGKGDYDIDMRDTSIKSRNWTPLMWACEKGHFEIVKLLLQYKADSNLRAKNGWTAFHVACSKNQVRIVNFLMKNGADPNSFYTLQSEFTPLMYISSMDDMEPLARSLLKWGADPNIPEAKLHWTPLTQASYSGKKELVLLYLENKMTNADRVMQSDKRKITGIIKTDIEMRTNKGWTALTAAIKRDRGEIVEILIDSGISTEMTVSKRESKSEPALHLACYLKCTNAVRALVRKEGIIDVNQTNDDGLSALMIAIRRKNFRVVEALLESGRIDVNLQQRDTGLTAIFLAAKKGNIRTFEKLLQCGAVDKIDSMSVLDVESPNRGAISKSLQKHKAVVEQRQKELATPELREEKMQKLPKKITTMDVNQRLEFLQEEILKKYKEKMEHWKEHGTGSDETEKPEGLPLTEQSSDYSESDL